MVKQCKLITIASNMPVYHSRSSNIIIAYWFLPLNFLEMMTEKITNNYLLSCCMLLTIESFECYIIKTETV